MFRTAIDTEALALAKYEDIASREAVHYYFSNLLDLKGDTAMDKHCILRLMETEFFPFHTVAERFHLIEESTETIYIPQGNGVKLIVQLRSGNLSQDLYRKLVQYGVSVYQEHFEALEWAGALERLEDDSVILNNIGLYNDKTSLKLIKNSGMAMT